MRYLLSILFITELLSQSSYANQGKQKNEDVITGSVLEAYKKECFENNVDSCYGAGAELSRQLRKAGRKPVEEEAKSIFKYYELACDKGNADGCYVIAGAYLDESLLVEKDVEKAIRYLDNACQDGQVNACSDLADMYRPGSDVTKNPSKFVEYYIKGCELDDAMLCASAGDTYNRSLGVERDMNESLQYTHKACTLGFRSICMGLGERYRDGDNVKQDSLKAADYFKRGCEGDWTGPCSAAHEYINRVANKVSGKKADNFSKEVSAIFGKTTICIPSNDKPSSFIFDNVDCAAKYGLENTKGCSGELFFFVRGDEYVSVNPQSLVIDCLLYTSPSPRDKRQSRMPSSA